MNVFDVRIDGVPVWELIRFRVHREVLEQNGFGQGHTRLDQGVKAHLRGFVKFLKNCGVRNPYLANSSEVMFVGHPRRKKQEDGLWWDIYCDPIHDDSDLDSTHFERPYLLDHFQPAKTDGLRYLDLIQFGSTIQRRLGLHDISLPSRQVDRLQTVEEEIHKEFGARVNVRGEALEKLRIRRSMLWMYRELLKKISPKVVVLVVSYVNEMLIEACRDVGVPTVELQHGVIHRNHFGYHYPDFRSKELFPDYLLTWGDYWSECVELPIERDHIVSVGYPYLEMERSKYENRERRDQIVLISQGTVGKELSRFAVEVNDMLSEFDVVYKLHPGEYERWKEIYPWLIDAGVQVIDDDSVPLYRLFAESTAQVGVSSTAIYEGLSFGLETFLVYLPSIEVSNPLIQFDHVTVVETPEALVNSLDTGLQRKDPAVHELFKPSATENISNFLEGVTVDTPD